MLQPCCARAAPGRFSYQLRVATTRQRLDKELVRRKLSASTASAQDLISSGRVLVDGALAAKSSRLVSAGQAVVVSEGGVSYASRGGHKLAGALEFFGVDPAGKVAVDVGASTGGFTDCLLQRGVRQVFAVDVGRGQLLKRIADDPRVVVMDKCNVRNLTAAELGAAGGDVSLLTADLSFISLRTVMPNLAGLAASSLADLLLLVKPQFEVPRRVADRASGVITDPAMWRQAVDGVTQAAAGEGLSLQGEFESPIRGAAGNTEFFVHLKPSNQTSDQ